MGNPLGRKGLKITTSSKKMSPFLTLYCPIGTYRFYSVISFYSFMGNPLGRKGLIIIWRLIKNDSQYYLFIISLTIFITQIKITWNYKTKFY